MTNVLILGANGQLARHTGVRPAIAVKQGRLLVEQPADALRHDKRLC